MALKARFESKCSACSGMIHKGEFYTWNRTGETGASKYRHVDCSSPLEDSKASSSTDKATVNEASQKRYEDATVIEEKAKAIETKTDVKDAFNIFIESVSESLKNKIGTLETGKLDKEALAKELEPINAKLNSTISVMSGMSDRVTSLESREPTVVRHVIEVKDKDGESKKIEGRHHKIFPDVLRAANARLHDGKRLNIWLAGPAGTGKTTLAFNLAKALGLDYASTGALTESYKVFGFYAPGTGKYVGTPFRQIWEHGGVYLFDDCDRSDPNTMTEFNNFLANGHCTFPDGVIEKHKDCIVILTANTWGHGSNSDYVGAMKQDKATLDRFVRFFMDIDEQLELETCAHTPWAKYVQKIRAKVHAKGIKVLVTPRASYYGAALLETGMSPESVINATLAAGMSPDQWDSVKESYKE